MSEVFDEILNDYDKRSQGITQVSMSDTDKDKLGVVEDAVKRNPFLKNPMLIAFHEFLDSIKYEQRAYTEDGSQQETKWTLLIPTLKTMVEQYEFLRKRLPPTLQDHKIIMALKDYNMSTYTKTSDRLSHPFICGDGEVKKAIRLNEVLRSVDFGAEKGYLVSVGAIFGLLNGEFKDLNTKVFLDYCKDTHIGTVCANTIDKAQLKQITNYGNLLGIHVNGWREDGSKVKFSTTKKSIVVIDGYSIKFQSANYVNEFKKRNPNSIIVTTITKPKKTRSDEEFDTILRRFKRGCHYKFTLAPYGNPKEEAMAVVGKYSAPEWGDIKIPTYTYSPELIELFCNSF